MKKLIFFPLSMLAMWLQAQPVITVEVSADTVFIGETVDVTYTIEGGEGDFLLPDLSDLPVVSGPNSSSSFIYQNGKMSSSQSYSFTMLAIEAGKLTVPGTSYQTNKEKMAVHAVDIIVMTEPTSPSSKMKTDSPAIKTTREKRKF
jgi:hypothetical protein